MNPGTVLEKKYRLENLVDKNILGGLYLATNIKSNKKVLINFLPYDSQTCVKNNYFDKHFIEIDHTLHYPSHHREHTRDYPNIFITNFGEVKGGCAYLVLEEVNSPSLEEVLAQKGNFSPEEAVKIVLQICSSIMKVNSLGVIYRNINPATIMLDISNNKINALALDFDIDINKLYSKDEFEILCKTLGVDQTQATKQIDFIGANIGFMTPEKCRGCEESYPQAEIYTLGILLYLILSGNAPFTGKSSMATILATIHKKPPTLTTYPDVSQELDNIVQRALSKKYDQRQQSILELANELKNLLSKPKMTENTDKLKVNSLTATTATVTSNELKPQINHLAVTPVNNKPKRVSSNVAKKEETSFFQTVANFFSNLLRK